MAPVPQELPSTPPHSLDFLVGLLVIIELFLTACVATTGRGFQRYQRGAYLNRRKRGGARLLSALLLACTVANCALIVVRLVVTPSDLGNKDEMAVTGAALGVLWWTDILLLRLGVRRRHRVAGMLARIPSFRFGPAGQHSPTANTYRDREFVVRAASWPLYFASRERRPNSYWRGHVAYHSESSHLRDGAGGSLIVLYDHTAQDEAGADLLTPHFTHDEQLGKRDVALIIWRAVCRARLNNLDRWRQGVCSSIECSLGNNAAVRGLLDGELATCISGDPKQLTTLNKVVWAALTAEVLAFLATGRKMYILRVLVQEPMNIKYEDSWNVDLFAEKMVACIHQKEAVDEESAPLRIRAE